MIKRITSLVLCLMICIASSAATASISESADTGIEIIEDYTEISSISCVFYVSGGTAYCTGYGRGRSTDTSTTVRVTLQKSVNGSTGWTTITTWSASGTGTQWVIVDKRRSVSDGYYYRIYVSCTIKDANGAILESDGMYSDVCAYQ